MVRPEKAEQVKALKGTMTEQEAADKLNVSLKSVRELWGPPEPPAELEGLEFIMAEYKDLIKNLKAEAERLAELQGKDPDNRELDALRLKAIKLEKETLREMTAAAQVKERLEAMPIVDMGE